MLLKDIFIIFKMIYVSLDKFEVVSGLSNSVGNEPTKHDIDGLNDIQKKFLNRKCSEPNQLLTLNDLSRQTFMIMLREKFHRVIQPLPHLWTGLKALDHSQPPLSSETTQSLNSTYALMKTIFYHSDTNERGVFGVGLITETSTELLNYQCIKYPQNGRSQAQPPSTSVPDLGANPNSLIRYSRSGPSASIDQDYFREQDQYIASTNQVLRRRRTLGADQIICSSPSPMFTEQSKNKLLAASETESLLGSNSPQDATKATSDQRNKFVSLHALCYKNESAAVEDDGVWMLVLASHLQAKSFAFRKVSYVSFNLDGLQVNPCDDSDQPLFKGTHTCSRISFRHETCVPVPSPSFSVTSFKCCCSKVFSSPFGDTHTLESSMPGMSRLSFCEISPESRHDSLCPSKFPRGSSTLSHSLLVFTILTALAAFILIFIVATQRKVQDLGVRGWALIEIMLFGAIFLYNIVVLEFSQLVKATCCLIPWLRALGFTAFYGAVVLKCYRNLVEFRVRRASHVQVREKDLLKFLAVIVSFTVTDEVAFVFYGLFLCYKSRKTEWSEKHYFGVSLIIELIISFIFNIVKFNTWRSLNPDMLLLITFLHLHLTITPNVLIILIPKLMYGGIGQHSRAVGIAVNPGSKTHPSLVKLRDELNNGTLDLAQVSISEMDPDDIRAELKRVYTQLHKLSNNKIIENNPHISKRKGGKKGSGQSGRHNNRRLSLPYFSKHKDDHRGERSNEEETTSMVKNSDHEEGSTPSASSTQHQQSVSSSHQQQKQELEQQQQTLIQQRREQQPQKLSPANETKTSSPSKPHPPKSSSKKGQSQQHKHKHRQKQQQQQQQLPTKQDTIIEKSEPSSKEMSQVDSIHEEDVNDLSIMSSPHNYYLARLDHASRQLRFDSNTSCEV